MSTWTDGRSYRYYGHEITCVRRYFAGPLEMVDLKWGGVASADTLPFTRAARTLAPCVLPRVTETLGGVCLPGTCHHYDDHGRVRANAGPFVGQDCCAACGTPRTEKEAFAP